MTIDYIVITNGLHAFLRPHHLVRLICDSAEWFGEANTNKSFKYEIQLINFLKLLIYNFVFLGGLESAWHQALCKHCEQLYVLRRTPREQSWLKEAGEFGDDVREQIVHLNRLFNLVGYIYYLTICWIVEVLIPIILQIKAVVAVDGIVEGCGQRQAITESLREQKPGL